MDAQLYPVFTIPSDNPIELKQFTQDKLTKVQYEIEYAISEIQQRIESTAKLNPRDEPTKIKINQVLTNLNSIHEKLKTVTSNYRIFLEKIASFLDRIIEIKTEISEYFHNPPAPIALTRETVNQIGRDHEQFREHIMINFRSLISQSEHICQMIQELEPPGAVEHDSERIIGLLEKLKINFESENITKTETLRKQHDLEKFHIELNEIHKNLNDIDQQLQNTKDLIGDSAASVKAASISFDYFEQTIKVSNIFLFIFVYISNSIRFFFFQPKN